MNTRWNSINYMLEMLILQKFVNIRITHAKNGNFIKVIIKVIS